MAFAGGFPRSGVEARTLKTMKIPSGILALSVLALPAFSSASNLLPDGSFELSGAGALDMLSSSWNTDLDFRGGPGNGSGDAGSLYNESTYVVANGIAPHDVHDLFRSDLSAQDGSHYMIVNGSTDAGKLVLGSSAPIAISPNTNYYFQGYAASVYPDAPAMLTFKVDYLDSAMNVVNSATGAITAPAMGDNWQLVGFSSLSGSTATSARISIVNSQLAAGGNDFALDNLSFSNQPVPEPASMAALGLGALGILKRRRKA